MQGVSFIWQGLDAYLRCTGIFMPPYFCCPIIII